MRLVAPGINPATRVEAETPPRRRLQIAGTAVWILALSSVLVTCVILLAPIDHLVMGLLVMVLLVCLLFLGVQIGVAMIAVSLIGLIRVGGTTVALSSLQQLTFSGVASWTLNVIPLFVLMGILFWRGGITTRAYSTARMWLRPVPGGLGVATNASGALLATSSGSTIATTLALGRMALPEMMAAGYSARFATASVTMAGTLGQLIPPSILLIIYAGLAQVSVGAQLMAAVVPGIAIAVLFMATSIVWAVLRPSDAPRLKAEAIGLSKRIRGSAEILPLLFVVITVLGGMFSGVFTASEAAAFGALVAFVLSWFIAGKGNRGPRPTFGLISRSAMDAVVSVTSLFIIIIGALMMTRVMAVSGLAPEITAWMLDLDLSRAGLLVSLVAFYIILGMFLESLPMILLTFPLLQAPLEAMGIDLVWFGVFLIIMCEIGLVFPPIGLLTFIVHRIAQNPEVNRGMRVSLGDVFWGVMPFVAAVLVWTGIMIAFPDIVLWLPSRMDY